MKKTELHRTPIQSAAGSWQTLLVNQNGSVTVIALMVLAVLTVIGVISSDTVVTENLIIRNVGIHKQNVDLAESALMQGLQEFMQLNDNNSANFDTAAVAWINNINGDPVANPLIDPARWYETLFTARYLGAANSRAVAAGDFPLLTSRGENGNNNLRYAIIGWEPVQYGSDGSESVSVGSGPTWHGGRIVAEYVSTDAGGNDNGNGLMRMEIGVKRKW